MKSLSLIFLLSFSIFAQQNPGAKQIALSNSDVALSDNVFALFNNPAGLAQVKWREIGAFYSPSPFGLKELSNAYAAYLEPTGFGSLAIGGMTYGFNLYRENKVSLGVAYNYENKLLVGTTINFQNVKIKNYGSASSFIFDIGIISFLTRKLHLGFSFHNVTRASYGSDRDDLPIYYQAGLGYKMIRNLAVLFSIEKDIRYKISPRFGLDYKIIKYLSLRTGFSRIPSEYSFGVGIHYSIFNFNYAFFTHPELGITHQAGIVISFKNK